MLEIKKTSITLRGISSVTVDENQIQVVDMHAIINEIAHSNVTTTIVNQKIYEENKEACRADIDSFTAKIREIEDIGLNQEEA